MKDPFPRTITCPVCGRRVRTCYPTGNPCDAEIISRHKDRDSKPCKANRHHVKWYPEQQETKQ